MAKKEKGVGPYTDSDTSFLKRQPTKPFSMGKDISRKVDENANRNDGFPAPLTSDE